MTPLRIFSFLICLSFASLTWGQAIKNTTLIGHLPYSTNLTDIWGYVDGNGDEYALVGLLNGVSIVDLSDPAQPTQLHFIPGVTSGWRDLKTYQDFAYVSNETDSGITIIDLSGLPGNIAYKDTIIDQVKTAHNLYMDAGRLYVIGFNDNIGGFKIWDLTNDPWNPTPLGAYNQKYVHDVYVRNNLAYAAEISAGLLTIVDVSDPANTTILGSVDYPGSFTHNTWLNDAGNICFTTDELPGAWLQAWDVSDPGDIKFLDRIRSSVNNGESSPHNVHVLNDYLITSYYADGLHIVDASRPHNLVEVGFYDTSPLADGSFNGAWGAYPFLPSGLILVSDQQEGLFVVQPDLMRGCYLEGNVTDSVTGAPIANVEICFLDSPRCELSLTTGAYATGIADSGFYHVEFSKYGYATDTISVMLKNGILATRNVKLKPLPRTPMEITVVNQLTQQPVPNAIVKAVADQQAATFFFTTDNNGKATDNRFVINDYQIIAGKWGYITKDLFTIIDSSNNTLTIAIEEGYYDDFSLDFGWNVSGNAERGMWEKGEPVGTYRVSGDIYNPEYDLPDDIGDEAYVTGNAGGAPFGDDVDNGFTWLVSPPIDLSGYTEPVLQYYWWFLNWSLNGSDPDGPGNDSLKVFVYDGIDTVLLATYDGPFDTTWNLATNHFVNLIDTSQQIRFMFYTQDLEPGNQDAIEAAIDGFRIVEASTLSIDPTPFNVDVQFFPNPFNDQISISFERSPTLPGQNLWFDLIGIDGQLVQQVRMPHPDQPLKIKSTLPAGMYIGIIRTDTKLLYRQKLLRRP
ncbi:MAG: choice-of-anchor B family protein [Bacteroidetes bacterium]|nr:choice-of-anchor B family protein [Bacteroidota bacterium]